MYVAAAERTRTAATPQKAYRRLRPALPSAGGWERSPAWEAGTSVIDCREKATSRTEWNRSLEFFSRHRCTTRSKASGTAGLVADKDVGSRFNMASMVSAVV